jgi:hypothetical protein
MEESLLKPVIPSVRSTDGGNRANTRRTCFFCRSEEHLGKDCPKIAAKKRNGTWVDTLPSRMLLVNVRLHKSLSRLRERLPVGDSTTVCAMLQVIR